MRELPNLFTMRSGGPQSKSKSGIDGVNVATLEGQLSKELRPAGLSVLGWFSMLDGPNGADGMPAVLIGNSGQTMWARFLDSGFSCDGQDNPLDRWTKFILEPIAVSLDATALYPFLDCSRHKDYWPFQQWARRAIGLRQSPPGLLIDPQFGLWQAFRGVLVFQNSMALPGMNKPLFPCDDCVGKPCLSTCPAGAILEQEFKDADCRNHANSPQGTRCRKQGCIARNACPVGKEYTYCEEQQAFHMRAYL